jgi:FecR protein
MQKSYRMISYFIVFIFLLVSIAGVSAQNVSVLGEIQSSGEVFIGSSNGKWSPAMSTYPLLQDSGIRTEDGRASIFFKDGSRVDFSQDTIASITGEAPNYSIHLAKGVIAFNVTTASSLSVSTPSANISVNSRDGLVQKVGYEKPGRVLGVISATEKGTEVRNISGKILVSASATGSRQLVSGESVLVGPNSTYKVYKTQLAGGAPTGGSGAAGVSGEVLGLIHVAVGGTAIAIYDHNHPHNASPYIP